MRCACVTAPTPCGARLREGSCGAMDQRRQRLAGQLGTFMRQYTRKRSAGHDPNDDAARSTSDGAAVMTYPSTQGCAECTQRPGQRRRGAGVAPEDERADPSSLTRKSSLFRPPHRGSTARSQTGRRPSTRLRCGRPNPRPSGGAGGTEWSSVLAKREEEAVVGAVGELEVERPAGARPVLAGLPVVLVGAGVGVVAEA